MNIVITGVCWLSLAVFDVTTIPITDMNTRAIPAHADGDGVVDLFIPQGNVLTIHSLGVEAARQVSLPGGTTVFDVADVDEDGLNEVVCVSGDRILSQEIPKEGDAPSPTELFKLETLFSSLSGDLYTQVLCVEHEGRVLLALPREDGLELRRPDGSLEASFPYRKETGIEEDFDLPFRATTFAGRCIGEPQNVLEMVYSSTEPHAVDTVEYGLPIKKESDYNEGAWNRMTASRRYSEIASDGPESWPWFDLRVDGETAERALYAPTRPDYRRTRVRILEKEPPTVAWPDAVEGLGPERKYSGLPIISRYTVPDFNGDGYVDLMLWSAPRLGTSVSSLTRTIVRGTLPIRAAVHLFVPEKRRFEPKPSSSVSCKVPVSWLYWRALGSPFRDPVFRDFNGDGKIDCAWSRAPDRFDAWVYGEEGFAKDPDFTYRFPVDEVHLVHLIDFEGQSRTSVVFLGEGAFYILHAQPDGTGTP